ncbi:MAG TPA: redoxin domain-containing protein [Candidatus Hydrogenedentes bacterium]|nr:redoxin domain-containing protein [Candidatus Hydrogenedentota bacterium]
MGAEPTMKGRTMFLKSLISGIAVAVLLAGAGALAAELGDPAAPLAIKEWVKGTPVSIEKGKVYGIEFWATWCGPCRTSIPHLTKVQKEYAGQGVTLIGITNETDSKKVRGFVEDMGDQMDYTVAIDDEDKSSNAYMKAYGARGIPHAFVVDKQGLICWEGHPMDGLEEILDKVLAGEFDIEAQRQVAKAKALMPVYGYLVTRVDEPDIAQLVGKRIVEYAKKDAAALNELAGLIVDNEDIEKPDLDLALEAAKTAHALSEGKDEDVNDAYYKVLKAMGKDDEAKALRK